MNNINKSFSGVSVLNNVSIEIEKGEIHALLGENGAGKSTLMNILGGALQPNDGSILINEEEARMTDPRVSQSYGISFIHQELNVVTDLRVYETVFLGGEILNKFGFLNVEEMCRQTSKILYKLGVDISPKEYVRNLDTSHKQMIEISKSLLWKSKLIIMDEPTTALADHEIKRLIELIKRLKESGVSIIYISHKLKEIMEACDKYTVLRDGEVVGEGSVENEDLDTITELMVGEAISQDRIAENFMEESVALKVKDLTSHGLYKNINFTVNKGEIVGFTGLIGDGRTELFESLFGYRKKYTGDIIVNDKILKIKHPQNAIKAGIGLVPKDRKENAIVKDLSVIQNMSLSSISHFEKIGFINQKKERKKLHLYKQELSIKVSNPNMTIDKLSGGNQQKVVIAKWLEVNPNIIIFDNPTQGVDIGAKEEIYRHIVNLAKQGKAIIVLSSEAPEVLKVCNRINVMYKGEITGRFKGEEATEDIIMRCATGANTFSKKEEGAVIG